MKYEIVETNHEKIGQVYAKFAELKKAKEAVESLEKDIEKLIEENNLQGIFPSAEKKTKGGPREKPVLHWRKLKMLSEKGCTQEDIISDVQEAQDGVDEGAIHQAIKDAEAKKRIKISSEGKIKWIGK